MLRTSAALTGHTQPQSAAASPCSHPSHTAVTAATAAAAAAAAAVVVVGVRRGTTRLRALLPPRCWRACARSCCAIERHMVSSSSNSSSCDAHDERGAASAHVLRAEGGDARAQVTAMKEVAK
ncbi:hypothetical protein EON68_04450 [archaeon]|nr:MAG: hypothetical protein EON68_04450 [archaeon]